jgi:hypothetical protein
VTEFSAADTKLATLAGVREDGVVEANGQPGFLVFGPYGPLEPWVYRLVPKGNLSGSGKALGVIDVAVDKGQRILAVKPIVARESARRVTLFRWPLRSHGLSPMPSFALISRRRPLALLQLVSLPRSQH